MQHSGSPLPSWERDVDTCMDFCSGVGEGVFQPILASSFCRCSAADSHDIRNLAFSNLPCEIPMGWVFVPFSFHRRFSASDRPSRNRVCTGGMPSPSPTIPLSLLGVSRGYI